MAEAWSRGLSSDVARRFAHRKTLRRKQKDPASRIEDPASCMWVSQRFSPRRKCEGAQDALTP